MNRMAGETCFQPLHPDTGYEKIEKTVQPVIGLGLLPLSTLSASLERTRHFRCLIASSTLKGSFCRKQHIHVYVNEEEWEVIYRFVIDGKEGVLAIILHGHFLEIEVSHFSRSEASFFRFTSSPP